MHQLFPRTTGGVRSRKTTHVRPTATLESSVKYRSGYGIAVFLKIWQTSISETTVKYVARSFLCRTRCDLAVERTLNCRGGIVLPCRTTFVCFFFVFVIILPYLRVFFIATRRNCHDYLSAERGIFNFVKFAAWTGPSSDPITEYSIFGLFSILGGVSFVYKMSGYSLTR